MAGTTILTDLDPKDALKIVKGAAKELNFTVTRVDDFELRLERGSLVLSILLGAFIAYCDFRVIVDEGRKKVRIDIERNNPWWTGWIGVSRVTSLAKQLGDLIEQDIEDADGKVYGREDN
jgi:hypothetical protein